MQRLMKLYFYRLFRSKSFYVFMAICGAVGIVMGLIVGGLGTAINQGADLDADGGIVSAVTFNKAMLGLFSGGLSAVSSQMTSMNSGVYGFPTMMIIYAMVTFYGSEIRYGTLRNMVVSGCSRKTIYTSYAVGNFFYAQLLGVSYTVLYTLVILIFRLPVHAIGAEKVLMVIGMSTLFNIMLYAVTNFLMNVLKGSPGTVPLLIGIHLVCALLPMMIPVVLAMGDVTEGMTDFWSKLLMLFPTCHITLVATGDLSTSALNMTLMGIFVQSSKDYTAYNLSVILIEELVLILGCFFGGWALSEKSDLK